MRVNRLTHTLTHTRKCHNRRKAYQRGSFAFPPVLFRVLFCLHHLRYEAALGLRCLVLLLAGGVGVGAESEPRIVVPQHTADSFHVHAVL